MAQAYYSSSEENIIIGRDPVTSLSEAVPAHVMDLVWELDLNKLLKDSGIVAPSQVDTEEKIHKKDGEFFLYKVGTDNNTVDTDDEIKVSKVTTTTPANVALTYNGLKADNTAAEVKVGGATEELAMVELAKRLKVIVTAGQPNKVVIVPATENTYSTISVVKIAHYTIASENPLDSPAQLLSINRFMASLKSKAPTSATTNWYSLRDSFNAESMGAKVKRGLANLFDKERKLNDLLGSAADSSVFLDLAKIETKMSTLGDDFYNRIFSVRQLQEVLDAVYDKNSRVDENNFYNFSAGDSITGITRVKDGDTSNSAASPDGNSDRWLITLKQIAVSTGPTLLQLQADFRRQYNISYDGQLGLILEVWKTAVSPVYVVKYINVSGTSYYANFNYGSTIDSTSGFNTDPNRPGNATTQVLA